MLEIRGLRKRYGDVTALADMTFQVRRGELFGFVGSNGAGKTTTMRIVMGVLNADAGEVRFDDRPIDLATRRRIGYMPEERGLYPRMPVGAQLRYFARLHGLSAAEADAAAQTWMDRLAVAHRAQDDVQKLSLGNQQRVQLAAALVHDPDLLVLDEPFSGLDPVAVEVMSRVLRERSTERDSPVLFSSHQLELVERICDRVGIVRDGVMVACGTVDELRDAGPARLSLELPDAEAGWAAALPGVTVHEHTGIRWVLQLDDDTVDDQAVLAAALRTGPVREFARVRPGLTELFRDVVSGNGEES